MLTRQAAQSFLNRNLGFAEGQMLSTVQGTTLNELPQPFDEVKVG